MNLTSWSRTALVFGFILLGIMAVDAQENISRNFIIDDMKSSNLWHAINDSKHNCSIDISPVDSGLKISYDLKEENSWVDIYKDVDLATITKLLHTDGMDKISFHFTGSGAPNTLEFKLVYEDGTNFGYERNCATNSSDNAYLSPWEITYWWGGKQRLSTEPVDFSKVKQIRFAISNNPDKKDTLGKGFVVINEIKGEKSIPMPPWWEKYMNTVISGIFGLVTGLVGYYSGRKSRLDRTNRINENVRISNTMHAASKHGNSKWRKIPPK